MGRPSKYSAEVRERAVRMVLDHRDRYDSQWAAICSIAEKLGFSTEALRRWLRQAEQDQGLRPGLTTDERRRLKELTAVALALNTRPRKTLGWKTPAEAFDKLIELLHEASVATTS